MKIAPSPQPRRQVKTVPLNEETNVLRRHEIFAEWSLDEDAGKNFDRPGIGWGPDLDPDEARIYRESVPGKQAPTISSHRRAIEVIADDKRAPDGRLQPKSVTWLMESRPEHEEQFSYLAHSEWEDGKVKVMTRSRSVDGVAQSNEIIVPNYQNQTLTIIETLAESEH